MKIFSSKKFLACLMATLVLLTSLSVGFVSADVEGNFQYELISELDENLSLLGTYAVITKYTGSESAVTVPSTLGGYPVKFIEYAAFKGNGAVTSVTIPNTVEEIGDNAFENCVNLTQLNLPDTLTSIGYGILTGTPICENGEYWEDNLLYIGKYLLDFDDSSSVTDIKVKEGTTLIASLAFAFSDITSVTLPSSLKIIDVAAFSECKNLTSITLPQELKTLRGWAFDGSGLKSVTVPSSVKIIGDSCFANCENLTSVTLPDTIEKIPSGLLENCTSLKSFNIPASVTLISFNALANTGLTTIHIPAKVNEIWDNAFAGCEDLTNITVDLNCSRFYAEDGVLYEKFMTLYTLCVYPAGKTDESYTFPDEVKYSGLYAFDSVQHLKTINLHENSQDAKFWNAYSVENVFVSDLNEDFYDIDGVVFDSGLNSLHYYPAGKKDSTYTTPAGCTLIESSSISDNPYLEAVTVSEGVDTVEYCAINKCENLKTVNLPSTLTYLSTYEPISDCDSLETINFTNTKALWDSFDAEIYTNSTNGLYLNCTDGTFELVAPYEEETDFTDNTEPTESASTEPTESAPNATVNTEPTEPTATNPAQSTATEPTEANPTGTTPTAPEAEFELGDVNMDKKLNIRDATAIQKHLAKIATLSEDAIALADFTQDGKVNIKDATTIQKKIAGII